VDLASIVELTISGNIPLMVRFLFPKFSYCTLRSKKADISDETLCANEILWQCEIVGLNGNSSPLISASVVEESAMNSDS
jgi:hypothetical protein